MDFLSQVKSSLAAQTLGDVRNDMAEAVEYANKLRSAVGHIMALPTDRRQDSFVALMIDYDRFRTRLMRIFANLRVLQSLQALVDPIVNPPGLNEQLLDADLFVEIHVFVAHAEKLGAAPATSHGFLKKLEDVVRYFGFVEGKLPKP